MATIRRLFSSLKRRKSIEPEKGPNDGFNESDFNEAVSTRSTFKWRLSGRWGSRRDQAVVDYDVPTDYREPSFGSFDYNAISQFIDQNHSPNTISSYRATKGPFHFLLVTSAQNETERVKVPILEKYKTEAEEPLPVKECVKQVMGDEDWIPSSFLKDMKINMSKKYKENTTSV